MYINIVQYKVYCMPFDPVRWQDERTLILQYTLSKILMHFFVIQIICHYLRKYNTNTYCTYGQNLLLYSIPVHVLQYDILSYVFSIYSILVLTLYRRSGSDHWQAETVNI